MGRLLSSLQRWLTLASTPLFDKEFYERRYPQVCGYPGPARLHYLRQGVRDGLWPNELFDPEYYESEYPDVAQSGLSPLEHYIRIGASEDRRTCRTFDAQNYRLVDARQKLSPEETLEHAVKRYAAQREVVEKVFQNADRPVALVIDRSVPRYDCDAGGRSTFHYVRFFVDHGYHVLFLPDDFAAPEPYVETLEKLGVQVLFGDWFRTQWGAWLEQYGDWIDVVFMNRPDISIKYLDALRSRTSAKLLYYGHDLHSLRMEREYALNGNPAYKEQSELFREWEEILWEGCDVVYYPSSVEIERIKSAMPQVNAKAIPLLLYGETQRPEGIPYADRRGILFVGGFAHQPNVDAVEWFCSEVYPLLDEVPSGYVFNIVGSGAPEHILAFEGQHVHFLGRVSDEELVQLYARNRLVVVPLRFGAGVKGKIVEALRWGACVLTTSIGAEGMPDVENAVAIADDPRNFADSLKRLYEDTSGLENMSKTGYTYFQNHFSYDRARALIGSDIELKSE